MRYAVQCVFIASAFVSFLWFSRQRLSFGRCKWEPIYISFFGVVVALVQLELEDKTFVTFNVSQNNRSVSWLRFLGWFITFPVLLMHLANLPGETEYNLQRSVWLTVCAQIMIVSIITATILSGAWSWIWFFAAVVACGLIFTAARKVFAQAFKIFPEHAKWILKVIAVIFYSSWSAYILVWFLSPSGTDILADDVSHIMYVVADLFSHIVYCLIGWHLRWNHLRNREGLLDENTRAGFQHKEPEIRACVIVADANVEMTNFVMERLKTLQYDGIVARDPLDLHGHLFSERGDIVVMSYDVASADNHKLPADIFARHKVPIIAYGHNISLTSYELRKKFIVDVVRGLPTDTALGGVLERWKPIPGMDDPFFNRSSKWRMESDTKAESGMDGVEGEDGHRDDGKNVNKKRPRRSSASSGRGSSRGSSRRGSVESKSDETQGSGLMGMIGQYFGSKGSVPPGQKGKPGGRRSRGSFNRGRNEAEGDSAAAGGGRRSSMPSSFPAAPTIPNKASDGANESISLRSANPGRHSVGAVQQTGARKSVMTRDGSLDSVVSMVSDVDGYPGVDPEQIRVGLSGLGDRVGARRVDQNSNGSDAGESSDGSRQAVQVGVDHHRPSVQNIGTKSDRGTTQQPPRRRNLAIERLSMVDADDELDIPSAATGANAGAHHVPPMPSNGKDLVNLRAKIKEVQAQLMTLRAYKAGKELVSVPKEDAAVEGSQSTSKSLTKSDVHAELDEDVNGGIFGSILSIHSTSTNGKQSRPNSFEEDRRSSFGRETYTPQLTILIEKSEPERYPTE